MPNFDKTGPAGKGPMTGCMSGVCVDNKAAGDGLAGCGMRIRRRGRYGHRFMSNEGYERFLEEKLEAVRRFKNNSQK